MERVKYTDKELRELEDRWFAKIKSMDDPHLPNLTKEDEIELAWMGFNRFPRKKQSELLHNLPREEWWPAVLQSRVSSEYSQLMALVRIGTSLRAVTPSVFVSNDGKIKKLDPEALSLSDSNVLKKLAVYSFSRLSEKERGDITGQKTAFYPSADWWLLMNKLVAEAADHITETHKAEKRAIQMEEQNRRDAVHAQKQAIENHKIPKVNSVQFQTFMRDVVFGRNKGELPYPVYPSYMRLPEGDAFAATGIPGSFYDVESQLEESTGSSPGDGCKKRAVKKNQPATDLASLQPHQAVVNAMIQMRISGMIDTSGLLVMHSTGAGKSHLSVCAIVACWNLKCSKHEGNIETSHRTRSNRSGVASRRHAIDTSDIGPIPIFLVSVKSNNVNNGLEKLAVLARQLFPDFVDEWETDLAAPERRPFAMPTVADTVKCMAKRLQDGFCYASKGPKSRAKIKGRGRLLYTFTTLGNDLNENLYAFDKLVCVNPKQINAMFVIDEAQYLNLPADKGKIGLYTKVKDFLTQERRRDQTWCMAMTATPGETKEHAHDLLKVVTADRAFPNPSSHKFKQSLRGVVSYAQLYGDLSHFAVMEPRVTCVDVPTDSFYGRLFMKSICSIPEFKEHHKSNLAEQGNKIKLLCKGSGTSKSVLENPRRYKSLKSLTNFVMTRVSTPKNADTESSGGGTRRMARETKQPERYADQYAIFDNGNEEILGSDSDDEYVTHHDDQSSQQPTFTTYGTGARRDKYNVYISPKLALVIENITKLKKGKHFVYSNDPKTLAVIAQCLMKTGWTPLTNPSTGLTPGKRFLLITPVSGKKSYFDNLGFTSESGKPITDEKLHERVEECKKVVNRPENSSGKNVQVILASNENFKGVDMNHLRYLHLVDAMTDYQDFIQFVGRGSRYCAHHLWKMPQRVVTMFFYRMKIDREEVPSLLNPDDVLWEKSVDKYRHNWDKLEKDIQECSIDRYIFEDNIHKNTIHLQEALKSSDCNVRTNTTTKSRSSTPEPSTPSPRSTTHQLRKADIRARIERQKAKIAARRAIDENEEASKNGRSREQSVGVYMPSSSTGSNPPTESASPRSTTHQLRKAEIRARIERQKAKIAARRTVGEREETSKNDDNLAQFRVQSVADYLRNLQQQQQTPSSSTGSTQMPTKSQLRKADIRTRIERQKAKIASRKSNEEKTEAQGVTGFLKRLWTGDKK